MENSMTALVSCFARAYHTKHSAIKVYDDPLASKILSEEEYQNIAANMTAGRGFFCPGFTGTDDEALELIVNSHLAPSVLARSAFNQRHLANETRLGARQYVIVAAGYDTSGYMVGAETAVYELDRPAMIEDKCKRAERAGLKKETIAYVKGDLAADDWENALFAAGFDCGQKTHCSMLGLSYYLKKEQLAALLQKMSAIMPKGSTIVLDYPNTAQTAAEEMKQDLAKGAGEEMQDVYSAADIAHMAQDSGLLVYEDIGQEEIERDYFASFNAASPRQKLTAPVGVSYCLLVKHR